MNRLKLKFRLKTGKGSVSGFTDAAGVTYLPGDIVDLPPAYEGEAWLERVKAVHGDVKPVEASEAVPLEPSQKNPRKKSKP